MFIIPQNPPKKGLLMKKYWKLIFAVSACVAFHTQSFSNCVVRTCEEINTMPNLNNQDRAGLCESKRFCVVRNNLCHLIAPATPESVRAIEQQTHWCTTIGRMSERQCLLLGSINCRWIPEQR